MTLYSLNGTPPAPLPWSIRLSDGRLRTDPATFTPEEIADAGYVHAPASPEFDPETQHAPAWDGAAWTVLDKTAEELAAELAAAKAAALTKLAADRWEWECSGLMVETSAGALPIATDDRAKLLIAGKRTKAEADPGLSCHWKTGPAEWALLTAADVLAISDAVEARVQAAFDRERDLAALIADGDLTVVWSPPDD